MSRDEDFYEDDEPQRGPLSPNPLISWWYWRGPGWWWARLRGRAGFTREPTRYTVTTGTASSSPLVVYPSKETPKCND